MIKRTILIALCAAGALATPALAGSSANNNASYSGATHGAFADVNDNFGWLGEGGGTPGYHGAVGQESGATGYNNSHVVGNPQGSGPENPPPSTY